MADVVYTAIKDCRERAATNHVVTDESRTTASTMYSVEICRDEHPGLTLEDVKPQPVLTGDAGSLFEIKESRTDFYDVCVAHCVTFMGNCVVSNGISSHLLTDDGTQLISKSLQTLCAFSNTKLLTNMAHNRKLTGKRNALTRQLLQDYDTIWLIIREPGTCPYSR